MNDVFAFVLMLIFLFGCEHKVAWEYDGTVHHLTFNPEEKK